VQALRCLRFFCRAVPAARVVVMGSALLALGGCAKNQPLPPGIELAAPPGDMSLKLELELGGAVELLGAKLTPTIGLKPGSRVELVLYWRKKAAVPRGFALFTHLLDEAGESILNLDATGPLRKLRNGEPVYPPSAWDEGKVYVDQVSFWVPATVRTETVTIVCGLFRGHERLPLTAGAQKGERIKVATFAIKRPLPASAFATPTIWVPMRRPASPIVIDGKLDDASWTRATTTGSLVNVSTGEPAGASELSASVRLVYDEQALYVGFEVFDDDLRGGFDPALPDPYLWTKDAVEVMIDPDGDGDNLDYYEIQVGPQNLVFDSAFDAYNLPREPDGPYGHQEWSANLQSAVQLQGTLDDAREDDGYVVEMAIPWASLSKAKRTPPNPEDTWRMNFYAMQNNGGVAWSPILGQGNFHKASRFGRVRFAGPAKARR
jgi:hypothetical protein